MDRGAQNYRRYLSGEDAGLVELVTDYKDPLFRFLCGYLRDESIAEELTEEVFFRLAVKKPHFRGTSNFRTWLFSIGRNLSLDHLRRQKRREILPLAEVESLLPHRENVADTYEKKERLQQLHSALAKLPKAQREVLHLAYFSGLSADGIATVIGKSRRGAESLLYRARKRLKAELEEGGFVYEEQ